MKNMENQEAKSRMKILVVDDEKELAAVWFELLSRKGYNVLVAHGGMEALELAKGFLPNLILSDVSMPAGTGYDLLRGLKESGLGESMTIAMMTGYTEISEAELQELGAVKVFHKPVRFGEIAGFVASIERAL